MKQEFWRNWNQHIFFPAKTRISKICGYGSCRGGETRYT